MKLHQKLSQNVPLHRLDPHEWISKEVLHRLDPASMESLPVLWLTFALHRLDPCRFDQLCAAKAAAV